MPLVLTRKVDQQIWIGADICVTVVEVRGTGNTAQVRLAIMAPDNVEITRPDAGRPKQ